MKAHKHILTKQFVMALCALALAIALAPVYAAQQAPNFAGNWTLRMQGGGGRGRNGGPPPNNNGGNPPPDDNGGGPPSDNNGGGPPPNGGGRGMGHQTLVITANGDNFQVDHKTPRGDVTSQATLSGDTLSWTEQREGRGGQTMNMKFSATVDGDTMQGTVGAGRNGQFTRPFTAKRMTDSQAQSQQQNQSQQQSQPQQQPQ